MSALLSIGWNPELRGIMAPLVGFIMLCGSTYLLLGTNVGGLSGPAIKPIALRCVHQVAAVVRTPLVGIGGISNLDDVMEFLVTGATAVQIGTANYFDPGLSERLVDLLPGALAEAGVSSVVVLVGTLRRNS